MAKILINGGSHGVGRGICEAFIKNGDTIFFTCNNDKNRKKAMKLLSEISKKNNVYSMLCDSRQYIQVKKCVKFAYERMEGIDILVNNAAIRKYGSINEINVQDWINAIDTNINGYFYFVKEALPYLLKSEDSWIFNIGSTAGNTAFAGGISYNTTKAAVHGFSSSLELDVRLQGIRVCNLIPGNVYNKELECPDNEKWMLKPIEIGECIVNLTKLNKHCMTSTVTIKPTNSPEHPAPGIAALRYV